MDLCTSSQNEEHAVGARVQECISKARSLLPLEVLADAEAGAGDRLLTAREQSKLLLPLLRLRQACCHPQVTPREPLAGRRGRLAQP
jgi:hypothetical protein